jgi:hypothetical protein
MVLSGALLGCQNSLDGGIKLVGEPVIESGIQAVPTVSVSINSGAAYTTSTSVTLALTVTGSPTKMYITNTAGCTSGGSWQTYASTAAWTLATPNAVDTVYVQVKKNAQSSTCVATTITHDNIAPTLTVISPVNASYISSANVAALAMNGTCSENGRVINITGAITSSATCTSGAWSTTLNLTSVADGAVSLTFNHNDAAGNIATPVTLSLTKDTAAPVASTISINGGSSYTNSLSTTLTLAATGATQMYITQTAGCSSGGSWSAYATSSPWTLLNANALNTIYAKFRDAALNESSCISASITHDNIAPTLTVISPVNASYISSVNVAALAMNGNCSENGRAINITGAITGSTTCASGAWSTTLNLSSVSDGAVSLTISHSDVAGNAATPVVLSLTKDTAAPVASTISINGGSSYTNSLSATLTLAATGATQMYITQTAGCSSGGSWSAYATSSPWTLLNANALNTIYAKFRDAALNESSCISASITHDNIAPTLTVISPVNASYISSVNVAALAMNGTCSENGRVINITGAITSSATCTSGAWSTTLNLSSVSDGAVSLTINHSDVAGNIATPITLSLTKITTAPVAGTISINGGSSYTNSLSATLALSATGATEMYITQTAGCTAGGSWNTYATSSPWTLLNANALNTVYAKFRDAALNESSCISASITHDNIAPTLTVSSPVNASYIGSVNVAALTMSGACSENGLNVNISGAVAGTATCTSGAWSTTLNLSSVSDGAVSLTINHSDVAGNAATPVVLSLTKITTAPVAGTISINGGSSYTNSLSATLALSATGATEMYITQTAGCSSGGSWNTYATSSPWTLLNANALNTVYAKFRDAALNESSCISASITHDNIAPTLTVISPLDNSYVNLSSVAAFAVNGMCSENGLNVSISGSISVSAPCIGGVWAATLNLSSAAEGPLNLTFSHIDAAGNIATPITRNLTKDTTPPVAGAFSINGGAAYANSSTVSLSLFAIGSSEMYITQTPGCVSGGSWGAYATTAPWTLLNSNASNTVYAKFRDAALNESFCVSASIIHDNIAPTLGVISPMDGDTVNFAGAAAVLLSGTCSENGRNINISGSLNIAIGCVNGAWNQTVDMSSLAEGSTTLNFDFNDAAGNVATTIVRTLNKDTVPPVPQSLTINGGATYTTSLSVTLGLLATEASTMYITPTAGCTSGGIWEAYATTKSWVLLSPNTVNSVYVKFRDTALNESACIGASITHDPVPAVAITSPGAGSYINLSNQGNFIVSGTCAPSGQNVVLSGAAPATVLCLGGLWTVSLDLSTLPDGSVTVTADYQNLAGAVAEVSQSFVKSTSTPNLSTLSIDGTWSRDHSVYFTNQTAVNLTLSSVGASDMYITNDSLCLSGGTWQPYATSTPWTLPATNQMVSVYARFRTGAGNVSDCVFGSILQDNTPPLFTVTTPNDNAFVNSANKSAFLLSGTCTETRIIQITGAVTSTANCNNGTWARTLNLNTLPDGNYTLYFDYDDGRGNSAPQIIRNFTKDTQGPTGNAISINNGARTTRTSTVTLNLVSADAAQMYITTARTCTSLGVWEPFNASKAWTLASANGTYGVYVMFKDAQSNLSPCYGATILADGTNPYWIAVPTHALAFNSLNSSPSVTYLENAIDLGSGVDHYAYAIGSGTVGLQSNDIKDWAVVSGGTFTASGLTLSEGSKYFVNMKVVDKAGNEKLMSSVGWTVDITPPTLTVASPLQNEKVTDEDQKISGTCESGNTISLSYGAGVTGPATALCVANTYSVFIELSGIGGSRTVHLTTSDVAGNASSADANFQYLKNFEIRGQILAMAKAADGSLFYGGNFSGYSMTQDPGAVRVNSSGVKDASFGIKSGFNGNVFAAAELADGSMIFGGDFTKYRGRIVNRIAKIDRAGNLDLIFSPQSGSNGTNATVRAVLVSGSSIYIGGDFTGVKGKIAYRVAKIDLNGNVDLAFNPGTGANGAGGVVRALALSGSDLYIGGDFILYRGASANHIAKVDAVSGVLNAVFDPTGTDGSVYSLLVSNGAVYLGGSFTTCGSSPAKAIAKVDISSGALDGSFSPGSGSNGFTSPLPFVYGLAAYGTDIIAVGKFSAYRGLAANNIAKIGISGDLDVTFSPSSGANGFDAAAVSVLVAGPDIYIGGQFFNYRRNLANHLAKISGAGILDAVFNPSTGSASAGVDGSVNVIVPSVIGGIYVAGSFTSYRPTYVAQNILKTDALGNIDTGFCPQAGPNGFNSVVRTLFVDNNDIYVGGDFTTYQNSVANHIARLSTGGVLDLTFNPNSATNGANGIVRAITVNATDVFVGGDFTKYRNVGANRLAKLVKATGALDTVFTPATGANGVNGSVYALALSDTDLFVGGTFTYYKFDIVNRIVKLNPVTGADDLTFSPPTGPNGTDGAIFSIVISNSNIYLGGAFANYRGTTVNHIAKILNDGSLDSAFSNPLGTNGYIYAMAAGNGSLFFTGTGTTYQNSLINRVGKVDLISGALDLTFSPVGGANGLGGYQPQTLLLTPIGTALLYDTSKLIIGGGFTQYRNHQFNYKTTVDMSGSAL